MELLSIVYKTLNEEEVEGQLEEIGRLEPWSFKVYEEAVRVRLRRTSVSYIGPQAHDSELQAAI